MKIAFTGPRRLTDEQEENILNWLIFVPDYIKASYWLVGDAPGADEIVRQVAPRMGIKLKIFSVEGHERWCFAKRTKAMIDALHPSTGHLIAFPNKPCPTECKPSSNPKANSSGTWLAIAYAKYKKIPITMWGEIGYEEYPDWMKYKPNEQEQLSLF